MDAFKGKYVRTSAEQYEEFLKVPTLLHILNIANSLLMLLSSSACLSSF